MNTDWSNAVSFARLNGTSFAIAEDPVSHSWLALAGTCFHASGKQTPEFLLQQFLSVGPNRLACDLEGFFAIVVGDGRARQLIAITDIIGSCHLYWRQCPAAVAISTSSLILAGMGETSLDPIGCQEFLGTGVMYEDRTFYREIHKLPPATITTFAEDGKVSYRTYWQLSELSGKSTTHDQAIDGFWNALVSAATQISSQYENAVCDLTGGYDSRTMAAALVGSGAKFSTVVSGAQDSADVRVSTGLARLIGTRHIHYPPPQSNTFEDLQRAAQLTDGEFNIAEYAHIARIHADLSRSFDLSINGSFGEVARGYWWELLVPNTGSYRRLDEKQLAARRYAWSTAEHLFQPQVRINLQEHMASVIRRATQDVADARNTLQMDSAYLRLRMQRWQGRIASSTNQIWPCLSPFMFRSVLEAMLQAPFALRKRSLLVRATLAKYQPQIAAYPLEHGYPATPASWKTLPKFWPLVPYYANRVVERLKHRLPAPSRSDYADEQDGRFSELHQNAGEIYRILDPGAVERVHTATSGGLSEQQSRLLSLEFAVAATRPQRDTKDCDAARTEFSAVT